MTRPTSAVIINAANPAQTPKQALATAKREMKDLERAAKAANAQVAKQQKLIDKLATKV